MKNLIFFVIFFLSCKLQITKSQQNEYYQNQYPQQRQKQEPYPPENNYPYFLPGNTRNITNLLSNPGEGNEKIGNLPYQRYPGSAQSSVINGYHDQGQYQLQDDFGSSPTGGIDMEGSNRHIPPSSSKFISGDYCWDPLFPCDTANTILYCIGGRCTCPSGWTMAPGNIPLNTVWHSGVRRCVSLIGSGCHVSANAVKGLGYVYCQPGIRCVRHPSFPEVGTCGASILTQSIIVIVSSVIGLLLYSLY